MSGGGKLDENLSEEELRKLLTPLVNKEQAEKVLRTSYATEGEEIEVVKQLDSYDDVNFLVKIAGIPHLLKIHNGVESNNFNKVYHAAGQVFSKKGCMNSVIHMQSTIMEFLSSNGINTSRPRMAKDTKAPVCVHSLPVKSGKHSPQHLVCRLLSWVEGRLMSDTEILPVESLADAGRNLGQMDHALDRLCRDAEDQSFLEPARRYHQWDGKQTADLRNFTRYIKHENRRKLVLTILDAFQEDIIDSGDSANFRQGINHADYNDANILLNEKLFVSGVIDFGDSVHSWRVLDVSVAMAYAMMSSYGKDGRSISAAAAVLRGYHLEYPLTPLERKHLVLLIVCRLACSATLGAFSYQQNPENTYLLLHAEPAWKMLEMIWCYDCAKRGSVRQAFDQVLNQACLYNGKPGKIVSCSDIVLPDPSTADLLQTVRIPSFYLAEPPKKKAKLTRNGLPVVTFVTGNQKKLEELERILSGTANAKPTFHLTNQRVDLPELQGTPIEIAKEKCVLAANEIGGAVIVEDTSLCFNALGGLPGPFIKWFLESCGLEGLNKLLQGYEDKSAEAMTVVAFSAGPNKEPTLFVGKTLGRVVMPRGCLDFGWDPVFQPDEGGGKTYGEMTKDDKDAISHRSRALAQMRAYFEEHGTSWSD